MPDHSARRFSVVPSLVAGISVVPAMAIAGAIGLVYAIILLGPGVAFGTSAFWDWPSGSLGGTLDIRNALAGYFWVAQDGWHWPVLTIANANWPRGANAGLMEIIPVAALLGKAIHSVTGAVVDLIPLWLTAVFVLNAAALTALVRALGQRSLLATVLAAGIGAMAPVIHHRFGHIAHSSHWIFILALALYVAGRRQTPWRISTPLLFVGLALLAASVNLYLFVMTAAIASAAILQAAWDRQLRLPHALGWGVLLVAAGILPQWIFGLLDVSGIGDTTLEFGRDSMNVVSPFWPQTSGAFSWTGSYWLTRGSIGATPGQYEGYAYLGLGALILVVIALVRARGRLWTMLRRNWILAAAMAVLTLWALSNRIYAGPVLVATFPVPDFLLHTVLAWFRASGRFFWPVAWLIVALGIAGALRDLPARAALAMALVALGLQWIDLSLWRARIGSLVGAPAQSVIGAPDVVAALRNTIATTGLVTVVPRIFCSSVGADYGAVQNVAANDVQLLAARLNARMTSAFVARGLPSCDGDRNSSLAELKGSGVLVVIADPGGADRVAEARALFACRDLAIGVACVDRAGAETPTVLHR